MSYRRYIELQRLLTAEETAEERAALTLGKWTALLKEYNQLRKELRMNRKELTELVVDNQQFYQTFTALKEALTEAGRTDTARDVFELSGSDLDRIEDQRAREADKLMASLDDPLLSTDQRQVKIDRLTEITGELSRIHQARRHVARRSS